MRVRTALAVSVVVLSATAAAQVALKPQATFQSGVDVVQVDVSVLDKDRRPVRGLTTADFTVLEDGKPRPIVAFTAVELPAPGPTGATASWVRDVPADVATNEVNGEGRLVVIMLDRTIGAGVRPNDHSGVPRQNEMARRIAAAAIDQLSPGDLAAVVYTSNLAKPQNFTADRARLLKALESLPQGPEMDTPAGLVPTTSGACYCGLCVPEAITHVAESLQGVPQRRKSLLFIGRGLSVNQPVPPYIEISFAGSGLWNECVTRLKDSRIKMFRAAELANLTITTFDPGGLEVLGVDASANVIRLRDVTTERSAIGNTTRVRQESLRVVSETTGGRAVLNTNAPNDHVPAVFQESSSYYVLGFQSADQARNGRFHKIEVRVNRRGVDVRARNGFNAPEAPAVSPPGAPVPPLADSVKDLLPKTGLQLSAVAMPFAAVDGDGGTVLVALGVRQPKTEPAPRQPEHVEIFTGAFNRNGRSPGWTRESVEVTRGPDASGTLEYDAVARLPLRPGTYEIRVAVDHREASRTGSVYAYVEVPDFAEEPVSLSGIVLRTDATALATPTDGIADVVPLVPSSRRTFARAERVTVFVRTYQGGDDTIVPVGVRAQIADRAGTSVFRGTTTFAPEEFGARRSADFNLDLPLQRLAAGEYLLTIDATRGSRTTQRQTRFTVR
jgi:VWFA-related protein